MKLLNAPWKMIANKDAIAVVDSKNFLVYEVELDPQFLPGTEEDERAKAIAVAALPDLLKKIEAVAVANEAEDEQAFGAAIIKLVQAYQELEPLDPPNAPKETDPTWEGNTA